MTFTQKKGRRRTTPSLQVNMWGQEVCRLWAACHLSGRSEVGRQPLPSPHQWRQWPSVLARTTCLSFRACFSKCRTRRHWQGWLSSGVLARTNRKLPWWQAAFSPRHFKGCVGGHPRDILVFSRTASWPQGSLPEPVAVGFARPSGQSPAITLPSLFWRFRWKLRCAPASLSGLQLRYPAEARGGSPVISAPAGSGGWSWQTAHHRGLVDSVWPQLHCLAPSLF